MMNRFANWLQQFLEERRETSEASARKAGISPSVVRRWLTSEHQPVVYGLGTFLEKNNASEQERAEAWQTIDLPRAVEQYNADMVHNLPLSRWHAPCEGDLWHALRLRNRLSLRQVESLSNIDFTLISRWENHKRLPSPEDRVRLCALYKTTAEEKAYLLEPKRVLSAPLSESLRSLDDCDHALEDWEWFTGSIGDGMDDLYYIAVECYLWNLLKSRPEALRLLVKAWMRHAEYLLWQGRLAEMEQYAERAWEATQKAGMPPERWWRGIVYCRARAHFLKGKMRDDTAIHIMEAALPLFSHGSEQQDSLYRDMGDLSVLLGQCDRARAYLQCAKDIALKNEDLNSLKSHNIMLSRSFEIEKRFSEAEALWEELPDSHPYDRIYTGLHKADVYYKKGDRGNARLVLDGVFKDLEAHSLGSGRDYAEYLSGLL